MKKRAIVIGAGFGGLALAIRLQSAGVQTLLIEARDRAGGCAYMWEKDGFTFDAGPTVITDPVCLAELWRLSGHDMSEDVTLLPVAPFYRLNWRDGTNFDCTNDETQLLAQIARLSPDDVAGYERFVAYAARTYDDIYCDVGAQSFQDASAMVRAIPTMAKTQAWRSLYSLVSSYVKDDKLRQALSFNSVLVGGSPLRCSAVYALIHMLEKREGVWFPRGGTHQLVQAMATHFERLGGELRLGDKVVEIETYGDRAIAVRTQSGWRGEADAVASNADLMHSYRDLLGHHPRGKKRAAQLADKNWSPSLFMLHFGIKGTWPGIPHHMVLFGPRFEGLMTDIYEHGILPQDFSVYLHHPTITDPSLAPEGYSTFYALVPVPNMGKFPIDWEKFKSVLADRILDEIQHRMIPDIRSRIVTQFHYTPTDFSRDMSMHLGSAFSLEPLLRQSGYFRAHNRDDVIPNLYFTGAGTHPGAGVPATVTSAKVTATLMLEDLK